MRRATIDLFCEDLGHEAFIRSLVRRCAAERDIREELRVRNSRGGAGRAISEFKAWQRSVAVGGGGTDLLILAVDANDHGLAARLEEMDSAVDRGVFPFVVLACPDPYVEAWYVADPLAFPAAFGLPAPRIEGRQSRERWKLAIRSVLEDAGDFLADVGDLAPDLVREMNLYRAGKSSRSFRRFHEDLGKALERLRT